MTTNPQIDPLLALRGSGRELWADVPADQYVRRLREGYGDAGPANAKASEAQMSTYDFKVIREPDPEGG